MKDRKLQLSRLTLRNLTTQELDQIAGGTISATGGFSVLNCGSGCVCPTHYPTEIDCAPGSNAFGLCLDI